MNDILKRSRICDSLTLFGVIFQSDGEDKTFLVNFKVGLCIGSCLGNIIVAMLIEPAILKFSISFTRN